MQSITCSKRWSILLSPNGSAVAVIEFLSPVDDIMSNARSKVLDLSHHFSKASKRRAPNVLKEYYKFLRVPEMSNLAGGI